MYFDEPKETEAVRARLPSGVLMSANGLALLLFGILPQPLMSLCYVAIASL
jgi:NADH-quinone oxidoreductase subunit N